LRREESNMEDERVEVKGTKEIEKQDWRV